MTAQMDFTHCPLCGEDNLEGGHVTIEENMAIQEVTCNNCDGRWVEIYTASRREGLCS